MLLSASTLAATAAQAQQAAPADQDEDPAIQEIVVTAQKRTTLVQETPLAVSVVSGDALQENGVKDAQGLAAFVPNVSIGEGSRASVQIAIRGVYSATNESDPSTAFHVDGIYYSRPSGANAIFYDIERIEVLRGPQGTLWGRNATAGSINVITRKPSFDWEVQAQGAIGNYGALEGQVIVNAPVIDGKWALRGAFVYDERDAYEVSPVANAAAPGIRNRAARLHSLFQPTERLTILLTGDYWKKDGQANAFVSLRPGYDPRVTPNIGLQEIEAYSGRAEVTLDLGDVELTSLSAWRREDQDSQGTIAGPLGGGLYNVARPLRLTLTLKDETFSQEVRLASSGTGPARWTIGAFYLDQKSDEVFNFVIVPNFIAVNQTRPEQTSTSYAAFGQLSYDIGNGVTLTGGLRYSRDEKSNIGGRETVLNMGVPVVTNENISGAWDRLDWKASADWQIGPRHLLYASVGTGYKSGGIDGTPFDPEKLLAYEIGSKNEFFDRHLQLNLAAFIYDYTDLQVGQIVNGQAVNANASSAVVKGVEVEFQALPVRGLRLSGSASYLDSRYGDYLALDQSAGNALIQVRGNRLQRAPEFSAQLAVAYTTVAGPGQLTVQGDWSFQSKVYFSEFGERGVWADGVQDPASLFNARVRYEIGDGDWFVEGFAKNIFDKAILRSGGYYGPVNAFLGSYGPPATYGIRTGFRF
ncbi:TonB-dependent receptor [Sphingomonas sp. AOB5]|uniref:TonB-dependent receptor n=1 Tax=Sphingomonas sp. AOB5 TaxID=3034017 RepID=UPI0023F9CDCB|nr:TonB-dependent receptor [Sphingomonas sp. AOB5]MDF7777848.1 TonB-dependent receptor [Sphingomonas sp. AOB5]